MSHSFLKGAHLTTAEAAALLDVSVATLKRWAQSGLLPSERTEGGHRRFRLEDVKALAEPPAQADDPVRRGADLVARSADALGLQGWLLQARRELGSWWSVAQPLRAVVAELYRRRAAGALGAVELEVALDRLRTALLRFVETALVAPDAPTLLVAAVPGDPDLVPAALLQLAAVEDGWRAEWAGRPEAADLGAELERRPARALVVCASLGASPEAARRVAAGLAEPAAARGAAVGLLGVGDGPAAEGHLRRLDALSDARSWLEGLARGPGGHPATAPTGPPAEGEPRWDPSLALGHAVIDAQHQTLFTHVADFLAAIRRGEVDPELPELLAFITDYARIHFRYEENLMRSTGFPGLEAHRQEHQQLSLRLEALVVGLGAVPAPAALEALATFLAGWLRGHVAGSDQRIGRHLRGAADAGG